MSTEIFRCVAGSRLFGTALPSSDTDYKAIHIPTARSILLGTADAVLDRSTGNDKSANTAEDVDMVSFPLQRYLTNLAKMEVNSLEMLFAPNMVEENVAWELIRSNRFRIMTASKKPFTGFAKQQAMRYAVRGERLDTLLMVVDRLRKMDPQRPVMDQLGGHASFWLADQPNVRIWEKEQPGNRMIPHMSVFGREISLTVKPGEAIKVYQKPIDEAGTRSRQSAAEGGPDWKGLYHAQRVVDEGIELYSTGEIMFPCVNSHVYVAIRTGQVELEEVLDHFEASLATLEELTPIPEFREKPDTAWIDEFVASVYERQVIDAHDKWAAAS